jgi:hypothetical protein
MKIPVPHSVALASVFRQSKPMLTLQRLQELYEMAAKSQGGAAPVDAKTVTSGVAAGPVVIGTAMDIKTGVFVQLVTSGTNPPLLTVGKRWAIEQMNPALNNTSITLIP